MNSYYSYNWLLFFFAFPEFIWRCILRKQLQKAFAVILGCMSAAILLAEATLLPSVDLSLFSILIKAVGKQEVLVQVRNWTLHLNYLQSVFYPVSMLPESSVTCGTHYSLHIYDLILLLVIS